MISLDFHISLYCYGTWFVNIKCLYFFVLNIKQYDHKIMQGHPPYCGRMLQSQYSHIEKCKRENNTLISSYDRAVTKPDAKKKGVGL